MTILRGIVLVLACTLSARRQRPMTYYYDHLFDDPQEMLDFFLKNNWFRAQNKYEANSTGKGGMIFRGQSDSDWELRSSAFRQGLLASFTPQPPERELTTGSVRRHLGRHLHAEARAIFIFLEIADSLGIQTPLDYTTASHGIELIIAALTDDGDFNYAQPFPTESFQRATALAQHHGVPTRFLDWTESPLVACYFAAFGASSFSQSPPREGQEISVAFLSTFGVTRPDSPVELVKAPRHENSNLRQQQGVFTNIKGANEFFIQHKRWPVLDDFSSSDFELLRVRLPAVHADDLLRNLFDLKITRHSMMPSLTTAAKAYEYVHVLFNEQPGVVDLGYTD